MTDDLPTGYTWRRARPADAEAIFDLVSRRNTEVLGFADASLDEYRNNLVDPAWDLETDSWLGYTPDGALAGFAWVVGKGTGEEVDADVVTRDDVLRPWMYGRILARAAELARAGGHEQNAVDIGIYRDDIQARDDAAARGFSQETVFLRMRVDHDTSVPVPVAPAGLTVHRGPGDEDFR